MPKDFLKRVLAGKPPVFFINDLEDAAIKSLPDNEFEVKLMNGDTFIQKPIDGKLNDMVATALMNEIEIDESVYDAWPLEKNPHANPDGSPKDGEFVDFIEWHNDKRKERLKKLSKKERQSIEEDSANLAKRMDSEAGA